ncbi:hypothetical protein TRFO_06300 [Tritrichomonas foetus]|uniref:C2 NT-type domain-containing protein n=1 Tax=Tritrichomonas foetus TaxID=1144522 RepID=A0A1J4JZK9_9EUKA|nr:hypothetical protein TRFO_06300 [Tritrichomonas foetus]|eukprot:OHT04419.1 hypothetical protein TRFO_06300 [Tritrichomonas foetus]
MKSSQKKSKIILRNIKLIEIPTRQNRIFLKAKQGSYHVTTKPYPIKENTAEFVEPVSIEIALPEDLSKAKHIKKTRLSFRLESLSGSGFTRYGIVLLDIVSLLLQRTLDIRCGLENCSEKPVFLCNIQLPSNLHLPPVDTPTDQVPSIPANVFHRRGMSATISSNYLDNEDTSESTTNAESRSMSTTIPPSKSITINSPSAPKMPISTSSGILSSHARSDSLSKSTPLLTENSMQSANSINNSHNSHNSINNSHNTNNSFNNSLSSSVKLPGAWEYAPTKIPIDRFSELEQQIDGLLASIINDEPAQ